MFTVNVMQQLIFQEENDRIIFMEEVDEDVIDDHVEEEEINKPPMQSSRLSAKRAEMTAPRRA